MFREREASVLSGGLMLFVIIGGFAAVTIGLARAIQTDTEWAVLGNLVGIVVLTVLLPGLFTVNPNEARVITLFGSYIGSTRRTGLWWTNPFTARRRVSMRIRNFESAKLKVNDQDGNPIEIAAIMV